MNEELGLKLLANLLAWTTEAREEYHWLKFMARYKYDGYQDFVAGKRFLASLIAWLRQFPSVEERRVAYRFVRERLVYLGPAEMNHLVRRTYHETIRTRLGRAVAVQLGVPEYLIWVHPEATVAYERLLRASLFFGLSDGARIDVFRRANTGIISNEQVLVATQIHATKWKSVLKKLREEQGDEARFAFVFLLDDFTASGATLVRKDPDEDEWSGKLVRFWDDVREYIPTHFTSDWTLGVHHYVGSHDARANIRKREHQIRDERTAETWFARPVEFSFGTVLPASLKVESPRDAAFLKLVNGYYDPAIQTKHTDVGGNSVACGFGNCALPLVLDHNTPNNSVALLWAESAGENGHHAMRPLFRRRQRHV
jgi:hypothetical protein